uniref:SH2 domain-containing protein n=1 Tax=Anabas testudineus TaxID=64144 RepID=A0A3Q1HKN2_ANATE
MSLCPLNWMMECHQSVVGQHDTFTWFTQSQLQCVIRNGIVPEWFHGIISRKAAEELLMCKPPGYFLIRVSESRIGYTLSYRAEDRCRHFMIDALEDGQYIIVGENRRHQCLQDLVDFHRRNPIIPFSEVLTVACGQSSNDKTDYAELLFPKRHQNPNTNLLQNICLHPNQSHPVPHEDMPPALPHRPTNLNSTVLPPKIQPHRLYPSLENEFQQMTTPVPTSVMPTSPLESLLESFAPLKQNEACVKTLSAPKCPSSPTANENSPGANIHPAKSQEVKPSVIQNLKKKFQKNRSTSQENMYTEINVETTNSGGNTETEYHVSSRDPMFDDAPLSYSGSDVTLPEGVLPQEYLPPPPFAPGY